MALIPAWRLLKDPTLCPERGFLFQPNRSQDDDEDFMTLAPERALGRAYVVAALVKSDRNPFTSLIMIGRAQNNDVVLPYPGVSKLHASVRLDAANNLSLRDEGSTFGTELNGVRLQGSLDHPLHSGDALVLGGLQATYLEGQALIDETRRRLDVD